MEEVELIKMIPHVVRSSIKNVCDFVSFLPCSSGGPRAVRRAGCKRGALNAGQAWKERLEKALVQVPGEIVAMSLWESSGTRKWQTEAR